MRVDLQNGVPAEEVMAKHGVTSRVITGIQVSIKAAAESPAAPAAGSKPAKAGSASLAGAGAKS